MKREENVDRGENGRGRSERADIDVGEKGEEILSL
jgi:hypothetical protein